MNLKIKISLLTLCVLLIISGRSFSQISLQNLKRHLTDLTSTGDYSVIQDSLGNANYVSPALNYYVDISKGNQVDNSNGQVSQMYATLGCYKNALRLLDSTQTPSSTTINQVNSYIQQYKRKISMSTDPIAYITKEARKASLMMVNEAHDFPYHRAFIISLLPALKNAGFKYLAMETLTNLPGIIKKGSLKSLSQRTGYYTKEPVFGELVRYALELGYVLVPYEYTPDSFTPLNIEDTSQFTAKIHQRDSFQALNLMKAIKGHQDGKILVIGGYDHTLEAVEHTDYYNPFHPMAAYFKELSKIDPLTINLVQYSKANNSGIGGVAYNQLVGAGKIDQPVCVRNDDTVLIGGLVQRGLSDIYTLLPETKYVNGRPSWLELNGLRKRYRCSFPRKALENAVLFQAYYVNEMGDKKVIDDKVPADQFMLLENNSIDFYLRPRFSYLILCRDINNHIIYRKVFQAK